MIRIYSQNLWNELKAKFEPGVLELEGSRIHGMKFGKLEGTQARGKILDFSHLYIGPSAIDLHVHSRDFDESHKETFASCEQAALKGGVSTAVCMANTRPRLDSPERVLEFFKRTSQSRVRFIPFAAATKNLEGSEPTDWQTLLRMNIAGLSDDGKPILNEKLLKAALVAAKKYKKFVSLHEEDTRISKASLLHQSEPAMRLGIEGSNDAAEVLLVARDLKIAAEAKAHIHFGHLSSAKSVNLIRVAKKKGQSISAELTPHHGLLTVEDCEKLPIEKLSVFKVCPPIRGKEDRDALRKAVSAGVLDCFASDHAPHSHFEKDLPMSDAAHGIISLEYFFSLYNELRLQSGWSWKVFYNALFSRPASLLPHLKGVGKFVAGYEASFVIFDPLMEEQLHFSRSASKNTPLEGQKVRGKIFQHWISGKKVYDVIAK